MLTFAEHQQGVAALYQKYQWLKPKSPKGEEIIGIVPPETEWVEKLRHLRKECPWYEYGKWLEGESVSVQGEKYVVCVVSMRHTEVFYKYYISKKRLKSHILNNLERLKPGDDFIFRWSGAQVSFYCRKCPTLNQMLVWSDQRKRRSVTKKIVQNKKKGGWNKRKAKVAARRNRRKG